MDLIPDISLVSIPPYHMAPAELTEFRKQLDELLVKWFIHFSLSPWGAPALFAKKYDGMMAL